MTFHIRLSASRMGKERFRDAADAHYLPQEQNL